MIKDKIENSVGAFCHKPLVKWCFFAFIGIWAVVVIILQIVLNSSVLTNIITKATDEFVDGKVTFSEVKASMFKSFPNLNVSLNDFSMTYPHDRFAAFDSTTTIGENYRKVGRGEAEDTLAHFDKLSVSINYLSLIGGKFRIRRASLDGPRIFLRQYDSTTNNWSMFKIAQAEEEIDSSAVSIPTISIGRASLENHPLVIYSNQADTIFGAVRLKELQAGGKFKSRKSKLSNISLSIDSLFVGAHLPADTMAVGINKLKINEKRNRFAINLQSKIFMALRSSGRFALPFEISGFVSPELSDKKIEVKNLVANLASLALELNGKVDYSKDDIFVDAKAVIDREKISDVLKNLETAMPDIKKLHTDARIALEATCHGTYNSEKGLFPEINAKLTIPESSVKWDGIDKTGLIDLELLAMSSDNKLNFEIPDFCLSIPGLFFNLECGGNDLLGDDPTFSIASNIKASLDSLQSFIPEDLDLHIQGDMAGNVSGDIKLSQLSLYNFSKSNLSGKIASNGIRLTMPSDTIMAYLGRTSINLEPEGERTVSVNGHNPLAITATIDSLYAETGASTFFRGSNIRMIASNSEKDVTGTHDKHPFSGHLNITTLGMMDIDSCFVGVKNSKNLFQLSKSVKKGKEVPYLTVDSKNEIITVREGVNRVTVKGAELQVGAHPEESEQKARRKRALDSLQRMYPGVPRDSLFRKGFGRLRGGKLPVYLSDKDFEKKDIDIRLSESMAKYIKEWAISGKADIKEVNLISPFFPLENKITQFDGKFSNDRIDLTKITLNSGNSDISAEGHLTGLRRALTGKGLLNLNVNITSDLIDLDQIFSALDAGSRYIPSSQNVALTHIDDDAYFDAVQMRTAELDTVETSSILVLPSNLNAKIAIQANTIKYSVLETSWLSSEIEMKERCLQAVNTMAMTNMGDAYLEAFYSTKTKQDLKAGFDLTLSDITAEKVIQLMPAVDSIIPMLQAFKGLLDCELAATASLDTCMNIQMNTLNGIMKIDGKDLSLAESEDLDKIRRTLMFKDKDSTYIKELSVRGIIKDNELEIFPFLLDIDRYTLAASGVQPFDNKFKYHLSALKSPIPFRFGININGTFDDWKWKLGKAKYKGRKIPLFTDQVDGLRFNLINAIHNIFDRGVDHAIKTNEESQAAIENMKVEMDYTADSQTDSLSTSEMKTFKIFERVAETKVPDLPSGPGATSSKPKMVVNNEKNKKR